MFVVEKVDMLVVRAVADVGVIVDVLVLAVSELVEVVKMLVAAVVYVSGNSSLPLSTAFHSVSSFLANCSSFFICSFSH